MYEGMAESPKNLLAYSPIQESKREQLERERTHLVSRIEDIDRALVLLAKHPDTEELLNLLRRL